MEFVEIGHPHNTNQDSGYGTVGYTYRIGKFEVTVNQWNAAIAADSRIGNAGVWSMKQPVGSISWYEAAKFANWLTTGDAYDGAYQFDASGVLTNILPRSQIQAEKRGIVYVLPTENEWHKAAYFKADGSGYTLYTIGDYIPDNSQANYRFLRIIIRRDPWEVGSGTTEENNGTYDMNGNLSEWCESAFDTTHNNNPIANRVFRGGSFDDDIDFLRSAFGDGLGNIVRSSRSPVEKQNTGGFRVAAIQAGEAFDPMTGLKYNVESGKATITGGGNPDNGLLHIPETIRDYPVAAIGNSAFKDRMDIRSLSAPSITLIEDRGFQDCINLNNASLPEVVSIARWAFLRCGLENIVFSNAVSIGYQAFPLCSNLKSIDLPAVTNIGNYAFYKCAKLLRVALPMAASIGDSSFRECIALTEVTLPVVTFIGDSSFRECAALEEIVLPAATFVGGFVFRNCSTLASINCPLLKSIGGRTFYNCSSLVTVHLPAVTNIGTQAFMNCRKLTGLFLPNIHSIGIQAFYNCAKLETLFLGHFPILPQNPTLFSDILPSFTLYHRAEDTDAFNSDGYWVLLNRHISTIEAELKLVKSDDSDSSESGRILLSYSNPSTTNWSYVLMESNDLFNWRETTNSTSVVQENSVLTERILPIPDDEESAIFYRVDTIPKFIN